MQGVVAVMQNVDAVAFVVLGAAVAIGWARRRDRSLGFLALAIVLLALVSVLGRLPKLLGFTPPLLSEVNLVAFIGVAYALLRYRGSLIPIPNRWHVAIVVAMVAGVAFFLAARFFAPAGPVGLAYQTWAAAALLVVWTAVVVEPIIRFWLVAGGLPAVQAWRLRSLSLGFAAFVLILVFAAIAFAAGASNLSLGVQLAVQLLVLAIIPLLYFSFAPPSWLRREWRAAEEEGLRAFMEDMLLSEDREGLADRALEWTARLTGGSAAAMFDAAGRVRNSRGLDRDQLRDLQASVKSLPPGVSRVQVAESDTTLLTLPIAGLAEAGRLVVLSGPFTPGFGDDEMSRVQQFMSAFTTALDRRQLIVQLKDANVQLQEANRHKSVFLASMSHELRTPLNAILGFSELLLDATNGQFPPATRKRFLEQIHSSGKHLLGLINDILDLSKIEAGQMELRLQTVDTGEVIKEVLSTVEPLAAQKRIQVTVVEASGGPITADPGKLKQMLLNLVSNAIKFTPEGGQVTVRATRAADHIELSVTDTGIGIAAGDQERVFHEFQQVDSGVGRQQSGTGLGLTLTRRFTKLHGGDVHVQSELGKGSVFTITLPLEAQRTDQVEVSTAAEGKLTGDASRPLILVVEDDPPAAELLSRQLQHAGFRTVVARTGTEAVAKARDLKPAAITLDILLPDLDGWEVLTRLKRDAATSDVPVVVVSVVDNPELGIALGALDYFVKPVPAKELISRLSRFNFRRGAGVKARILVVDDEQANRDWLRRVLEPAGFTVILASGGKEAIELAKSKKPDLVMLDLMMPQVTGFDVVEALRANDGTRATPIMVLTAKHLTESDIKQLNGHVSTILSRGSTGASDLLGLLRQVVGPTNPTK